MSGRILTFAKVSLASFTYGLYRFPGENTLDIYVQNKITKCLSYLMLTDTNRTSFLFLFDYHSDCRITERHAREIIFNITLISKLKERLDLPADTIVNLTCKIKV